MSEAGQDNELAITGAETVDHTVPAEVLARALEGLQRIVLLIAASEENQSIADRFKPSGSLRDRNILRCGVPRASSFAVPILLQRSETFFPEPGTKLEPLSLAIEIFQLAADGRWRI
jgi:hypothetical protein